MDLCRSWGQVGVGTSVGWRGAHGTSTLGLLPPCSSLGGSKGARLGAYWEGACTGRPPSWAEGRTEPANWASCAPEPIHLPTQLHHAACSQSRARPKAPGSLGVRRPWLRSQLGPLRAARSREATLLHRAHPFIVQNKWKQNDVHVHARGLGSGVRWVWNTRVCPCPPPPPFVRLHPAVALHPRGSAVFGAGGSAVPRPPPHSAQPRPGRCTQTWVSAHAPSRAAGAHRYLGEDQTHLGLQGSSRSIPAFCWPHNRPRPSHCVSTPRSAACRAPGPDFGETQLSPPTPSVRVPSPSDAATLAMAVHPPGPALHLAVIGAHSGLADAGVGGRWASAWWTGDAGKRGS